MGYCSNSILGLSNGAMCCAGWRATAIVAISSTPGPGRPRPQDPPPPHLHERLELLQLHGVELLCFLRHSRLPNSGHLRSVKPHKAVSCNSVGPESDTISRADDSRTTWRITCWIILKTPQSRTQPISRSYRNHGTGHTITFVFAV